jgi:hypothetical protein
LCALVRLGYDGPILIYSCHPFLAHGLNYCEVQVEIPIDLTAPWTRAIIGGALDDVIEKMVHVALTAMCERHLTDTADTPIALFPIWDQEEPE